jgi:hypothetical protein
MSMVMDKLDGLETKDTGLLSNNLLNINGFLKGDTKKLEMAFNLLT